MPLNDGAATGEYQDFVTGFVTADGQVWGRPVGVAVAADGSLMVSDDGSNAIWQVRYTGKPVDGWRRPAGPSVRRCGCARPTWPRSPLLSSR